MPKEIKKQITVTEYVCSNCGAVHKSKDKFFTCAVTGEAICTNCKKSTYLMEIGVAGDVGSASDYEVYLKNYTDHVKAELVKLSDSMLEYEVEDYIKVVTNLYEDFCKKMQEAHRAYLTGNIRDLL